MTTAKFPLPIAFSLGMAILSLILSGYSSYTTNDKATSGRLTALETTVKDREVSLTSDFHTVTDRQDRDLRMTTDHLTRIEAKVDQVILSLSRHSANGKDR